MTLFLKKLPRSFFRSVVSSRPVFNKQTSVFSSIAANAQPRLPIYSLGRTHARSICFTNDEDKRKRYNFSTKSKKGGKEKTKVESGAVSCSVDKNNVDCKINCEKLGGKATPRAECSNEEKKSKKGIPRYTKEEKQGSRCDVKAMTGTWVSKKCIKYDFSCKKPKGSKPIKIEDQKPSKLWQACRKASSKDLARKASQRKKSEERCESEVKKGETCGEEREDPCEKSKQLEEESGDPCAKSKLSEGEREHPCAKSKGSEEEREAPCAKRKRSEEQICKKIEEESSKMKDSCGKGEGAEPDRSSINQRLQKCKSMPKVPHQMQGKKGKKEKKPHKSKKEKGGKCRPCASKKAPAKKKDKTKMKKSHSKEETVCSAEILKNSANSSLVVSTYDKQRTSEDEKSKEIIAKLRLSLEESKKNKERGREEGKKGVCLESPKLDVKLPKPQVQEKDVIGGSKNFLKSVCEGILPKKKSEEKTDKKSVKKASKEKTKKTSKEEIKKTSKKTDKTVKTKSKKPGKSKSAPVVKRDLTKIVVKTKSVDCVIDLDPKYCHKPKKEDKKKGEKKEGTKIDPCKSLKKVPSKVESKALCNYDDTKLRNIPKAPCSYSEPKMAKKSSKSKKEEKGKKPVCGKESSKPEKKKSETDCGKFDKGEPERKKKSEIKCKCGLEKKGSKDVSKKRSAEDKMKKSSCAKVEKSKECRKVKPVECEKKKKESKECTKLVECEEKKKEVKKLVECGKKKKEQPDSCKKGGKKYDGPVDQSPIMQCIALCRKKKKADTPQKGKGVPPRDKKACSQDLAPYKKAADFKEGKKGKSKDECKEFVPCKSEDIKPGIRRSEDHECEESVKKDEERSGSGEKTKEGGSKCDELGEKEEKDSVKASSTCPKFKHVCPKENEEYDKPAKKGKDDSSIDEQKLCVEKKNAGIITALKRKAEKCEESKSKKIADEGSSFKKGECKKFVPCKSEVIKPGIRKSEECEDKDSMKKDVEECGDSGKKVKKGGTSGETVCSSGKELPRVNSCKSFKKVSSSSPGKKSLSILIDPCKSLKSAVSSEKKSSQILIDPCKSLKTEEKKITNLPDQSPIMQSIASCAEKKQHDASKKVEKIEKYKRPDQKTCQYLNKFVPAKTEEIKPGLRKQEVKKAKKPVCVRSKTKTKFVTSSKYGKVHLCPENKEIIAKTEDATVESSQKEKKSDENEEESSLEKEENKKAEECMESKALGEDKEKQAEDICHCTNMKKAKIDETETSAKSKSKDEEREEKPAHCKCKDTCTCKGKCKCSGKCVCQKKNEEISAEDEPKKETHPCKSEEEKSSHEDKIVKKTEKKLTGIPKKTKPVNVKEMIRKEPITGESQVKKSQEIQDDGDMVKIGPSCRKFSYQCPATKTSEDGRKLKDDSSTKNKLESKERSNQNEHLERKSEDEFEDCETEECDVSKSAKRCNSTINEDSKPGIRHKHTDSKEETCQNEENKTETRKSEDDFMDCEETSKDMNCENERIKFEEKKKKPTKRRKRIGRFEVEEAPMIVRPCPKFRNPCPDFQPKEEICNEKDTLCEDKESKASCMSQDEFIDCVEELKATLCKDEKECHKDISKKKEAKDEIKMFVPCKYEEIKSALRKSEESEKCSEKLMEDTKKDVVCESEEESGKMKTSIPCKYEDIKASISYLSKKNEDKERVPCESEEESGEMKKAIIACKYEDIKVSIPYLDKNTEDKEESPCAEKSSEQTIQKEEEMVRPCPKFRNPCPDFQKKEDILCEDRESKEDETKSFIPCKKKEIKPGTGHANEKCPEKLEDTRGKCAEREENKNIVPCKYEDIKSTIPYLDNSKQVCEEEIEERVNECDKEETKIDEQHRLCEKEIEEKVNKCDKEETKIDEQHRNNLLKDSNTSLIIGAYGKKSAEEYARKTLELIKQLKKDVDECKRNFRGGSACMPSPKLDAPLPTIPQQIKSFIGGSFNFLKSIYVGLFSSKGKTSRKSKSLEDVRKRSTKLKKAKSCGADVGKRGNEMVGKSCEAKPEDVCSKKQPTLLQEEDKGKVTSCLAINVASRPLPARYSRSKRKDVLPTKDEESAEISEKCKPCKVKSCKIDLNPEYCNKKKTTVTKDKAKETKESKTEICAPIKEKKTEATSADCRKLSEENKDKELEDLCICKKQEACSEDEPKKEADSCKAEEEESSCSKVMEKKLKPLVICKKPGEKTCTPGYSKKKKKGKIEYLVTCCCQDTCQHQNKRGEKCVEADVSKKASSFSLKSLCHVICLKKRDKEVAVSKCKLKTKRCREQCQNILPYDLTKGRDPKELNDEPICGEPDQSPIKQCIKACRLKSKGDKDSSLEDAKKKRIECCKKRTKICKEEEKSEKGKDEIKEFAPCEKESEVKDEDKMLSEKEVCDQREKEDKEFCLRILEEMRFERFGVKTDPCTIKEDIEMKDEDKMLSEKEVCDQKEKEDKESCLRILEEMRFERFGVKTDPCAIKEDIETKKDVTRETCEETITDVKEDLSKKDDKVEESEEIKCREKEREKFERPGVKTDTCAIKKDIEMKKDFRSEECKETMTDMKEDLSKKDHKVEESEEMKCREIDKERLERFGVKTDPCTIKKDIEMKKDVTSEECKETMTDVKDLSKKNDNVKTCEGIKRGEKEKGEEKAEKNKCEVLAELQGKEGVQPSREVCSKFKYTCPSAAKKSGKKFEEKLKESECEDNCKATCSKSEKNEKCEKQDKLGNEETCPKMKKLCSSMPKSSEGKCNKEDKGGNNVNEETCQKPKNLCLSKTKKSEDKCKKDELKCSEKCKESDKLRSNEDEEHCANRGKPKNVCSSKIKQDENKCDKDDK